ncbi:hypothetical protein G6F45_014135 [Rhizopus arrhizus]|nr:hypothetical protein G6F45_014135 [Rhizopus arrhizus]
MCASKGPALRQAPQAPGAQQAFRAIVAGIAAQHRLAHQQAQLRHGGAARIAALAPAALKRGDGRVAAAEIQAGAIRSPVG